MSENINDTDVVIIKKEVQNMVNDIKNNNKDKEVLQEKYKMLFKTSKTLFNRIYTDASMSNFNKDQFYLRLDKMLELIYNIQNSNISQNTASEEIGTILAKEYIPQLKDNQYDN